MNPSSKPKREIVDKRQSHIPRQSVFYEKVIPALLIGMTVMMALLIVIALGVLLGFVTF